MNPNTIAAKSRFGRSVCVGLCLLISLACSLIALEKISTLRLQFRSGPFFHPTIAIPVNRLTGAPDSPRLRTGFVEYLDLPARFQRKSRSCAGEAVGSIPKQSRISSVFKRVSSAHGCGPIMIDLIPEGNFKRFCQQFVSFGYSPRAEQRAALSVCQILFETIVTDRRSPQ